MISDYLAAEQAIIDRLTARLPEVAIQSAPDLAGVVEDRQVTPAVIVLYAGDQVPGGDAVDQGDYHRIRQRWMTVVSVRSARGQRSGEGVREAAGPLLTQVIQALGGWRPAKGLGRMVRESAPRPAFTRGGYGYFPLQWGIDLLTNQSVD
ncbi:MULTISPECIES: phage tail terminator protein [Halomonas]|uniref:Tail terminator n=1 Tax=Halomonas halophila TaxID=29573 RepID=A0ABQ0TZC5_9GAMM|nr:MULTISPECIES: hypothetical protein [Halomonas]MDR5889635.1 hypothetical protein [Halomonas salina]WJY06317.1 hypothetical protein QWG60_11425 [Halomonas halophila]GEK71596.1 hypothetical protein HHA04nite_01400 [Halomonas halophila]